ncbi:MAG TPA: hypothetical protein VGG09_15000 [Acidimicrobiales bacterium]|jgi:hypothetical protein
MENAIGWERSTAKKATTDHTYSPSFATKSRRFIAFLFEALAILSSLCFHDGSNASTEEVHMKIHSTKRQMPMVCAAAAAGHRALLG